jgi:hypothetical protein
MGFMIESEISKQYLLEEDAVEGFRQAVGNGQMRLALQILVDIIDVFEGIIASAIDEDEIDQVEAKSDPVQAEIKVEEQPKVAESKEEPKEVIEEKKTSTKKTAPKSEEATQVTAE